MSEQIRCADCGVEARLVHRYPKGEQPERSHPVRVATPVTPERRQTTLDEAWAFAESQLLSGWRLESLRRRYAGSRWIASAVEGGIGPGARANGTVPNMTGTGPSPAAALIDLGNKLIDRGVPR